MPLPGSVRRDAIEPTIVTSSPSRIHTVPRPMTTSQWNRDHGSRSRRAGIVGLDRAPSRRWYSLAAYYPTRAQFSRSRVALEQTG